MLKQSIKNSFMNNRLPCIQDLVEREDVVCILPTAETVKSERRSSRKKRRETINLDRSSLSAKCLWPNFQGRVEIKSNWKKKSTPFCMRIFSNILNFIWTFFLLLFQLNFLENLPKTSTNQLTLVNQKKFHIWMKLSVKPPKSMMNFKGCLNPWKIYRQSVRKHQQTTFKAFCLESTWRNLNIWV